MPFAEIRHEGRDEVCTLTPGRPDTLHALPASPAAAGDPDVHGEPRRDPGPGGAQAVCGRATPPTATEGVTGLLAKRPPPFTLRPVADMPLFFPGWAPRPFKP